jgi:hypothetical protein
MAAPTSRLRPEPDIDNLGRHCSRCGRQLVEVSLPCGYSTETGDPISEPWLSCPMNRPTWRHPFRLRDHDMIQRHGMLLMERR